MYNILENLGEIKIKVFNLFTIVNLKISLIGFYFNLINKKNKIIQIKLDLSDKNLIFLDTLQKQLLSKIYLLKLENNSVIGLENPYYASLTYSLMERLTEILFLKLYISDRDTFLIDDSLIVYFENEIILNYCGTLMLSIFDILWAILQALLSRSYCSGREKSKGRFNN